MEIKDDKCYLKAFQIKICKRFLDKVEGREAWSGCVEEKDKRQPTRAMK